MKKKRIILIILIAVVFVLAVYFTFYYYKKCSDIGCFNSYLSKCKKASFIDEGDNDVWLYKIKSKSGDECKVNVKLLQLKKGSSDAGILEGKDMNCYLPFSSVSKPQENLERCHGLLKEEMQKIMINKLHNYITSNLGQISEELKKAI